MDRMQPETAEEFYARVRAATGPDGRLDVAVEEMPGWDIFPFEIDSLQIKPLQPLAESEPPRAGEDPAECSCAREPDPAMVEREVWSNDRWVLHLDTSSRLPIGLNLGPREHCDLPTVPDHLAGEMGTLIVAVSAAVEALPAWAASSWRSTATAEPISTSSSSDARPGCSSSVGRSCSTGRRTSRRSPSRCTGRPPRRSPTSCSRRSAEAVRPGVEPASPRRRDEVIQEALYDGGSRGQADAVTRRTAAERHRDSAPQHAAERESRDDLVDVLMAFHHPTRRWLAELLEIEGPASVGRLAARTGLAVGSVSNHLKPLHRHGFIEPAK
jgi:hypothetical protein